MDYLRHIDPLPRNVRRFQKLRDAVITALAAGGECVCHNRIATILRLSPKKYRTQCAMIVAVETVSLNDPLTAKGRTG